MNLGYCSYGNIEPIRAELNTMIGINTAQAEEVMKAFRRLKFIQDEMDDVRASTKSIRIPLNDTLAWTIRFNLDIATPDSGGKAKISVRAELAEGWYVVASTYHESITDVRISYRQLHVYIGWNNVFSMPITDIDEDDEDDEEGEE